MHIFLVHFRAVDLRYLDATIYSLKQQDVSGSEYLTILDNDTETSYIDLVEFIRARRVHIPFRVISRKHGDPSKRCQSWSVNECFRSISKTGTYSDDWCLFLRSDYILDFNLIRKFRTTLLQRGLDWRGFITSYAFHMAYDERGDQRIVGMRDIEPTNWRQEGAQVLLEKVNGWKVDSSDKDAGVWLTRKSLWEEVGGLNENLQAWGYQQTLFQRNLWKAGVEMIQIPEFLFFHQHHGGEFRNYDLARAELEKYWGSVEDLHDFRDVSTLIGAVNDETPRSD